MNHRDSESKEETFYTLYRLRYHSRTPNLLYTFHGLVQGPVIHSQETRRKGMKSLLITIRVDGRLVNVYRFRKVLV